MTQELPLCDKCGFPYPDDICICSYKAPAVAWKPPPTRMELEAMHEKKDKEREARQEQGYQSPRGESPPPLDAHVVGKGVAAAREHWDRKQAELASVRDRHQRQIDEFEFDDAPESNEWDMEEVYAAMRYEVDIIKDKRKREREETPPSPPRLPPPPPPPGTPLFSYLLVDDYSPLRSRPFVNDWTRPCLNGIENSVLHRIGEDNEWLLHSCRRKMAEYINKFLCVVLTDAKPTFYMRTRNGHHRMNNMWNAYQRKALLDVTEGATHIFFHTDSKGKDKEVKFNPMLFWLEFPDRNTFTRPVFIPVDHSDPHVPDSVLCPLDEFNTYQGAAITRAMADAYAELNPDWMDEVKPWVYHVEHIMNSGEKEASDYVINFLAMGIQKPWEKPPTSLRCTSDEGAGKGLMLAPIRDIMGKGFLHIFDANNSILGKFNEPLATSIFVFRYTHIHPHTPTYTHTQRRGPLAT